MGIWVGGFDRGFHWIVFEACRAPPFTRLPPCKRRWKGHTVPHGADCYALHRLRGRYRMLAADGDTDQRTVVSIAG